MSRRDDVDVTLVMLVNQLTIMATMAQMLPEQHAALPALNMRLQATSRIVERMTGQSPILVDPRGARQ